MTHNIAMNCACTRDFINARAVARSRLNIVRLVIYLSSLRLTIYTHETWFQVVEL